MVLTGAALLFLSAAGMLHGLVGCFFDVVCCRFKLGACRPREVRHTHTLLTNTQVSIALRWDLTGFAKSLLGSATTYEQSEPSPDSTDGSGGSSGVEGGHFGVAIPSYFSASGFIEKYSSPFAVKLFCCCFFLGYHYKVVIL